MGKTPTEGTCEASRPHQGVAASEQNKEHRRSYENLTPFLTAREREHAGCQHRLFFSQVEYCDNLIFRRRAALDNLGERLLDATGKIVGVWTAQPPAMCILAPMRPCRGSGRRRAG